MNGASPPIQALTNMDFGASEMDPDNVGFETVQDDTDFPWASYPAPSSSCSSVHWDFSAPTAPHPYSAFPALEDDASWECGQGWSNPREDESRPNSAPGQAPMDLAREYEEVSRYPLTHGHGLPSNGYADLAKITEHEKWDDPSPGTAEYQIGPREHYRASSSRSSPHTHTSVPFRGTSRTRSDSDCTSRTRSQALCSTEGQSHPKRRQSWEGYRIPKSGEELDEKNGAITSKSSSKVAHSVIERRYRENLNTKITQLDQVLASVCDQKSMASGEKAVEAPAKTRKADVLKDAINYIRQAELESKERVQEILFLRLRVVALEKLAHCNDCLALR